MKFKQRWEFELSWVWRRTSRANLAKWKCEYEELSIFFSSFVLFELWNVSLCWWFDGFLLSHTYNFGRRKREKKVWNHRAASSTETGNLFNLARNSIHHSMNFQSFQKWKKKLYISYKIILNHINLIRFGHLRIADNSISMKFTQRNEAAAEKAWKIKSKSSRRAPSRVEEERKTFYFSFQFKQISYS